MAGWLLGPKALREFVKGRPAVGDSPLYDWVDTLKDSDSLYVSRLTLAFVRSEALLISSPTRQGAWIEELDRNVPSTFGHRLVELAHDHFKLWSQVRHERVNGEPMSEIEAFDVAICLAEDLAYVTEIEGIEINGLRTHSPW